MSVFDVEEGRRRRADRCILDLWRGVSERREGGEGRRTCNVNVLRESAEVERIPDPETDPVRSRHHRSQYQLRNVELLSNRSQFSISHNWEEREGRRMTDEEKRDERVDCDVVAVGPFDSLRC